MITNKGLEVAGASKKVFRNNLISTKSNHESQFKRLLGKKKSLLANSSRSSEKNGFFRSKLKQPNSSEKFVSETQSRVDEIEE